MNTEMTLNALAALSFPFSAIVGQEEMKRALIFNAIDPSIGGVLITGTRGTAKSTAARAMAALLPEIEVVEGDAFNSAPKPGNAEAARIPTPFVNLPVGATEDRVLGTLDVERVLRAGEKRFEPGLLARANRGVLYVDEVNLLPDHLIDVLLDAVAMGVNRVEREGVSFTHEARVILIGTMNPEEGELRPQLLDRFGLSVAVAGYFIPETRKEVVRRRMAFEADPRAYVERWTEAEKELSGRIERARSSLASVSVPDAQFDEIVEACAEARADGLRADIVAYKTARAVAAFDGRSEANAYDVEEALALALAHRRRAAPPVPKSGDNHQPAPPGDQRGETTRNRAAGSPQTPPRNTNSQAAPSQTPLKTDQPETNEREDAAPSEGGLATAEKVFGVGQGFDLARMISRRQRRNSTTVVSGRGSFAPSPRSGQTVRSATPRPGEKFDLAVEATIRAAALDSIARETSNVPRLRIQPSHWRRKQRRIRTRNLILLLVDASGSMAALDRMKAAKGAICSLLEDSYQRRDVIALIAFRGEAAEELLPPTRSAVFAYRRLAELPTGGRTPLAEGLKRVRQVIERQERKGERSQPFLVVITDGRATVPETGAMEAALVEAAHLRRMQVKGLCVDIETGRVRFGQARVLARELNAVYAHIQELPPRDWGRVIHEWIAAEGLYGD